MNKWCIKFVIKEIRSQERVNYKRDIVKSETIVNFEVEEAELNILLNCDESNKKFSYDKLFIEDTKNILKNEISEDMIKEYYVSSWELNFSDKIGVLKLSYPKNNLQ